MSSNFRLAQRAKKIGAYRCLRRHKSRRKRYNRLILKHCTAEIRKKDVRKKIGKKWTKIAMPATICLVLARNETLRFFSEVDKAFNHPDTGGIEIDHTTIENISIEAALLLTAEFTRMQTYAPKIVFKGKLKGMPQHVQSILEGVGYLNFYVNANLAPVSCSNTRYMEIKTGIGSDAKASGELIEAFRDEGLLSHSTAKRLGRCLIECLDNVSQHAYAGKLTRSLRKRWWMVGYCDKTTSEMYFAILDLGIGMPQSLRKRKREFGDDFLTLALGRSEEELIVTAFTRGFSSTKSKTRGFGLPGLKKIIDKFGTGQLRVFTQKSECLLEPNRLPKGIKHNCSLNATMLTWKLTPQNILENKCINA